MLSLLQAVTVVLLASLSPRLQKVAEQRNQSPLNVAQLRAAQQCSRFDAVIVDVENLRGKTGFSLSHAETLELMKVWCTISRLSGKLTLAVDHGDQATSYWIEDAGYSVVFAGPDCKADDTIALDLVPFFSKELSLSRIMVVTGDYELMQRCRHAVGTGCKCEILDPHALVTDLEKVAESIPDAVVGHDPLQEADGLDEPSSGLASDKELELGAELLEVQAQLFKRTGMNNKRRKKLRFKGTKLWQQLETESPAMLKRVVQVLKHGRDSDLLKELSQKEQDTLLDRWEKEQRNRKRRETTEDRVVLAEALRLELEGKYGALTADQDGVTVPTAKAYVLRNAQSQEQTTAPTDTVA